MPGCGVHFLLAFQVIDHWRRTPAAAPFAADDPAAVNAFLAGAVAPDMGYFPGGDPFPTDLAHYVGSADLARSLVGHARTDRQRAFAWGWVTHVLGDAWGHPLINEAAAELRTGRRTPPSPYSDDRVAHVRVELGLDAWLVAANPRLWRLRLKPVAGVAAVVRLLQAAYHDTYGIRVPARRLRAGQRASVRFSNAILWLDRLIGTHFHGRGPDRWEWVADRLLLRPLAWGTARFRPNAVAFALTHPCHPPAWLRAAFDRLIGSFRDRFLEQYANRLADLANVNLDTGERAGEATGCPLTQQTRARLRDLRSGGLSALECGEDRRFGWFCSFFRLSRK